MKNVIGSFFSDPSPSVYQWYYNNFLSGFKHSKSEGTSIFNIQYKDTHDVSVAKRQWNCSVSVNYYYRTVRLLCNLIFTYCIFVNVWWFGKNISQSQEIRAK